jgi:hypothetical protein
MPPLPRWNMSVEDKFNINLNQNLWGLVAAYGALGVAERWNLPWLLKLSRIAAVAMTISVCLTVAFYTWNYCRAKLQK